MQKLYAFNLYRLNENFVAKDPVLPDGVRREVYLAADVDQMRANFDAAVVLHDQIMADKDAVIAEMERACVRRVEELEKLAYRWLLEISDPERNDDELYRETYAALGLPARTEEFKKSLGLMVSVTK